MSFYRRSLIIVDHCFTPREMIKNAGILIENDFIVGIGGASAFVIDPQIRVCKYPGTYAMPGFIDTHIHGTGGFDSTFAMNTLDKFPNMSSILSSHGVTGFVPSILSAPQSQMLESVRVISELCGKNHPGAVPVGIHVEGPYVAREKLGSQYNDFATHKIDFGFVDEMIAEGRGNIKIWTFAPEFEHTVRLVERLCESNIVPSMGHTSASSDAIFAAIDAGATRCTHLYNGMPQLHQREISLAAIALTDDRITAEMIMDGTHVHPRMIDMTYRTKTKDRIIGISDAIQRTGVETQPNSASLSEDGRILGSTLTLETGWQRLMSYTGLEPTDAAVSFTEVPAHSIGLFDRGELRPGSRADIAIYDINTNASRLTFVGGKIVHTTQKSYLWND